MEEEGVPSTALREVSLLQMLSESVFVVRCALPGTEEGRERLGAPRNQNDSPAHTRLATSASPPQAPPGQCAFV